MWFNMNEDPEIHMTSAQRGKEVSEVCCWNPRDLLVENHFFVGKTLNMSMSFALVVMLTKSRKSQFGLVTQHGNSSSSYIKFPNPDLNLSTISHKNLYFTVKPDAFLAIFPAENLFSGRDRQPCDGAKVYIVSSSRL